MRRVNVMIALDLPNEGHAGGLPPTACVDTGGWERRHRQEMTGTRQRYWTRPRDDVS